MFECDTHNILQLILQYIVFVIVYIVIFDRCLYVLFLFIFPQRSTLWINIKFIWSTVWATWNQFWMSSLPGGLLDNNVMMKSWLSRPRSRRCGSSLIIQKLLESEAKTSSTTSLRNWSHALSRTSRRRRKHTCFHFGLFVC